MMCAGASTYEALDAAGTKPGDKLPVLFWIFGGGFELGSPAMYDATGLVANGVAQGKPFVFVSVNYRLGGFGFMPGTEILADGAANLGLLDQRLVDGAKFVSIKLTTLTEAI